MRKEVPTETKIRIADYIIKEVSGRKLLNPDSNSSDIDEVLSNLGYKDRIKPKVQDCLDKGMNIYGDTIDFEMMFGEEYVEILKGVWNILETDNVIKAIDTDLNY